MVDTAAHPVKAVLPPVPVRQWVLSLPFEIRYRLAWDGKLMSAILGVFLRVVYGSYRHQAKQQGHAAVCPRRTVGRCQPSCGGLIFTIDAIDHTQPGSQAH